VVEQARPDDDELTVQRIPEHQVEGIAVRVSCPASLMPVPLNDDAAQLLEEQVAGIKRMVANLDRPAPFTTAHDKRTGKGNDEHSLTPHPERSHDDRWFHSHTGDNPKGEFISGLPVVRPLPGQGVQPAEIVQPVDILGTQNRGDMEDHASMANGLLEHAKQLIGEIQETISSLTDRLDETAAGTAAFQAKGEEVVGSIVQAAEGSQTHNYRIQDAMALVHAAVNEQSQAAVDAIHLSKESLHRVYRTLAAAREDLNNVVF
jgi:hypothetical protein